LLAQSQILGGDGSAVAEQRAQEEDDRAHDAHHGTSVRGT